MATLEQLRSIFGGDSDEAVLRNAATNLNLPVSSLADEVGFDTGGKWGNRLSASVDSYQAGLLGVGEAVTGADWFRRRREDNEAAAEVSRGFARDQGAIMSYKDANSLGDYADWAGGMFVDSLPYLGEALVGGIAGRALLTGGRLGLSRAAAGSVGTTAASYPSAGGDILQNQRDENGTTDLGSAAAGGVPYALANGLFGLEGAIGRGSLARSGIAALDDLTGVRGALARTGATAGRNALSEGLSETAQEGVNQYFGRMAVNPDETLFNPEANDRYLESFVGGATLGGLIGGGAGGWRRSEGYTAPTVDDPSKPTNLLRTQTTIPDLGKGPQFSQLPAATSSDENAANLVQRYQELSDELGRIDSGMATAEQAGDSHLFYTLQSLKNDLTAQLEPLERQYSAIQAGMAPENQPSLLDSVPPVVQPLGLQPVSLITDTSALPPLQQRIDQNLGLNLPGAPKNYPSQFQEAASEPTNQWVVDPQTGMEHRLDIGQVTAIRAGDNIQLTPEQQNIKVKADELAAARTAAHNTFMGPAVDGAWPLKLQPREVSTYRTMDQLRQQGVMSQAAFEEMAGSVQEALMAEDTKTLNKINKDITAELAKRLAPAQEQVQGDTPSTQQTAPAAQPTGLQLNFGGEATAVPGEAKPAPVVGLQRKATAPTTPFVPAADEQAAAPAAPVEPEAPVAVEGQPTAPVAGTSPAVDAWQQVVAQAQAFQIPVPPYESLRADQQKQVEDLVAREQFNMAAADTVLRMPEPAAKPAPAVGLQRKATAPTTPFVPAAEEQAAAPAAPVEPATPVAAEGQPTAPVVGTSPAADKESAEVQWGRLAAKYKKLPQFSALTVGQAAKVNQVVESGGKLDVVTALKIADSRVSRADAKASAKEVVVDGVKKVELPYVGPSESAAARVETEQGADFRKNFLNYYQQMEPTMQSVWRDWIGFELDSMGEPILGENGKSLATIGAELENTKSGEAGMSKQAVHKRVKKQLAELGFDLDQVDINKARERITYSLAGTDADTISRNLDMATPGQTDGVDLGSEVGFEQYNDSDSEVASIQEAQTLGQVTKKQAEKLAATVTGGREDGVENFNPEAEGMAFAKDDTDDVGAAEDAYEVDFEAARQREEETGFLHDYLKDDLAEGLVLESDIEGARYAFDRMLNKGVGAFAAQPVSKQAESARLFARARSSGDPTIKKIEAILNAKNQPGARTEPAASDSETIRRGEGATQGGQPAAAGRATQAGSPVPEVQQAGGQASAPVVVAKKKRRVAAPAAEQKRAAAAPVDQAKAVEQAPSAAAAPAAQAAASEPALLNQYNPDEGPSEGAFMRWFGESKVVDSEGKPMVMYHGTGADITSFTPKQANAIFVTPKPSFAADFSKASVGWMERNGATGAENIMPVYVKAENPFDLDDVRSVLTLRKHLDDVAVVDDPHLKRLGLRSVQGVVEFLTKGSRSDTRLWEVIESAPVQQAIRAAGFDGFYVYESGVKNLAVFDPTQLKSAIGNNGNFDPTNPDIRYSKRAPKTPDGGFGAAERGTAPGETKVGYIHTTTDKQAFMDAYPGVAAAVRGLEGLGLRHIWDRVASIHVTDENTLQADGALAQAPDGSIQLWIDRDYLTAQDALRDLVSHELGGHLVDGGYGSAVKGKISGGIKWQVQLKNGKVTPVGAVARELHRLFSSMPAWERVLAYPFTDNKGMDANRVSEELFAQAAKLYIGNPEAVANRAPLTAAALQEAFKREAITKSESSAKHKSRPAARPKGTAVPQDSVGGNQENSDGLGSGGARVSRRNQKGASKTGAKPGYLSKAPSELADLASGIATSVKDWTFTRGAFTRDLLDAAAKLMPSASKYLDRMQRARVESVKLEREVAAILDDAAALSATERGTGDGSVNSLIRDMTYDGKWAFKPDWLSGVTPDPVLEARFNQLSDKAQDVVMRVFRHGHETLKQVQQAATDSIKSEVEPLIAKARAEGDMKTVKELERAKVKADGKFRRLMEIRGGMPYAPLRRFGNWSVVVKSKMYQDAQARGDKDEMDRLAGDGNHYRVEFVSNRLVAAGRANRLREVVGDSSVEFFERSDENLIYGGDSMFSAFSRFRKLAREKMEGEESKVVTALDTTLASMYMALVAETSARTSEFDRKNVAGADKDMLRSFATHGRAMANFIGSLKTSGAVMDILRVMKREAGEGGNRAEKSTLYNEILRRHAMGLNYEPNQLLDKSLAANSYWSLVTSPSYLLTNLTQPWVVSLPVLAGRFGIGRSSSEMFRAYKEIGRISSRLVDNPDAVKDLPKDVQGAVEELFNRGSIDISLGADLGAFTSGGDSKLSANAEKAIRFPRTLVERGEMVNRVATAVAAYRLAKSQGMKDEAAINYADKVIYETHGDYSAFNSPRVMRNAVGRFATQFRKFQLIQIALYARVIRDSMAKLPKSGTPEELKAATEARAVARRSLAYTLGTTFALGGLTAMPGFTAISFLMGAFGDDDEPDDPEATLRRALGGGAEADLLMRGVPNLLGMNLGNRIGAAGMLSILPYTDLEASREGYKDILMGVAGPFFGGTLPKALDGLGLIRQGDLRKGLEMLAPRGLADLSKGFRFGTEGVTKRNGDVVLSGDDVSFFAVVAQAMGLPTTTITDNQMLRNSQFTADEFYKDRTGQLKRQYVQAYRSGDGAKLQEIRAEWQDTQQARRRLGFKVQPLSTLLKAPQEQRKREAKPLNAELLE